MDLLLLKEIVAMMALIERQKVARLPHNVNAADLYSAYNKLREEYVRRISTP